ncbi:right-handed parallel beta-helix repeat-containing protein [Sphingomonas sp.]|jgi:hypothetical protein|uniref:right-handed parallel beta-helix repeat-containing protein n=1 Tax=Sphingomonas sp. TaxID=28214 RepID=UPI002ED8AD94
MIYRLGSVAIILWLVAPAFAQTVTAEAPLPDVKRDGRIKVVAMAARLGVPKGTVLTRCGETLVYVYGSAACPQADPFAGLAAKRGTAKRGSYAVKAASGKAIGPVWYDGWYRAIEGSNTAPSVGVTVRGVKITNAARDGISFCAAREVTVEDFDISHGDAFNVGADLPTGIGFGRSGCGVSGGNITIRNGRVSGFRMGKQAGVYLNGDGMAIERYTGVLITNVTAEDNADAGFDLKSTGTRLDALVARRNGRNFRFWGSGDAGTLTSEEPRSAHVWINAKSAQTWTIAKLVARSTTTAPILRIENSFPVTIIIKQCELAVPAGTPMLWGGRKAKVTWGVGCEVRR